MRNRFRFPRAPWLVCNMIDVKHLRDLQPDNSSTVTSTETFGFSQHPICTGMTLAEEWTNKYTYTHDLPSVEVALSPEIEAIMKHKTMHAIGLQIFRIPNPTAANPEDVREKALLYVQGKQEGGGTISKTAIEKIVANQVVESLHMAA
jgi:hypothetical protein